MTLGYHVLVSQVAVPCASEPVAYCWSLVVGLPCEGSLLWARIDSSSWSSEHAARGHAFSFKEFCATFLAARGLSPVACPQMPAEL